MIWNVLMWADRFVLWASCIAFFVILVKRPSAGRNATQLSDGRIQFPAGPAAYIGLIIIASSLPVVLHIALTAHASRILASLLVACAVLIICAILLDMPGTVFVDQAGITQKFWLRKSRRICWNQIAGVRLQARGPILVKAKDNTTIKFSQFLAGRVEFLLEIKKHLDDQPTSRTGHTSAPE